MKFLEFVTGQARRYPHFRLLMGAGVRELIMEDRGGSRGVRYWGETGAERELRALLTVTADGRFSRLRKLAGLEPVCNSPPMEVFMRGRSRGMVRNAG
ncbi:MAG: hypothetical protein ACREYF_22520 [Gammaproteobacteria bacterium]